MPIRITGMNSGLDTESIIKELVAAKQVKVDDLKKEQTKLGWKQDIWKELNSKLYKMFNGTLSDLRYEGSYSKLKTSVSNSDKVSVITNSSVAMNSTQKLKIHKTAKAGFLTGGKLTSIGSDGNPDGEALSSGSNLSKLGIKAGSKFEITTGGKTTEFTVDADTTISSFVNTLQSAGLSANFDAENQRMYIGSKETGELADFTFTAVNSDGTDALNKLGVLTYDDNTKKMYQEYANMVQGSAAWQNAVSAKSDALLAQYKAEKDNLNQNIQDTTTKQADLVAAYQHEYGDSAGVDITDAASRTNRKSKLDTDIANWNAQLGGGTLTDGDKAVIQGNIDKANAELSYLNGYETNEKSITDSQVRIGVLDSDYINADGTAGTKTNDEAEAYINAKIAYAQNLIAGGLTGSADAHKLSGEDAEIELNGATYKSSSNTFEINGLTITVKDETVGNEEITLTTEKDTSGIYDMIKSFIKEYGEIINEMDKLYNADSAKDYQPLTEDEKAAMSDKEVEKWEEKIKDSLLRRDSTLSTVSSAMKTIMAGGVSVNGKNMSLMDFGIETLGYFNAGDNEKNAYHINGDEDDTAVKSKDNDLLAMINSDPDTVVAFFTGLSKNLHSKLNDLMSTNAYSSINTVYEDKKMKEDYDAYTSKIKTAEKKLTAYEDKWYKKFSVMETALAKLQSNSSAVTSLLGG